MNEVDAAASIKTWCRLAVIYVCLTVSACDARNTLTPIAVDIINTRAIVLTWVRLTLVDIHRTVVSYIDAVSW